MLYKEYLTEKRDYQEVGYQFLLEVKHGCLFYKPGKGKTYPCIDALLDVNASLGGNAKVLILSTADAIKNMWEAEIVPQNILPKNTVLMTTSKAIQDETKKTLLKIKWDVIIVDESHKIKAHNSQISKLVYLLTKKVSYAWGLSGTPRGNNDLDIYCQFHNLNISEWGDISYSQFIDTCCDIDQKFFGSKMIRTPIGINSRYKVGWERNIAMFSQKIGYEENDDMPDLKVNIIKIPFEMTEEYKQCEKGCILIPDYETTMTKLAAISKLHQTANGFIYLQDNGKTITHTFQYNKKLDWLNEHITDEPTVIVYRHIADLENLQSKFNGKITENIDEFKLGKYKILLLQCSRCESFNLQICKRIIFYTLDYSFIKYNQMVHRCWRIGQDKDVTIDVLLFENTIEEKIWQTVQNKEKLSDLFMSIKGV